MAYKQDEIAILTNTKMKDLFIYEQFKKRVKRQFI